MRCPGVVEVGLPLPTTTGAFIGIVKQAHMMLFGLARAPGTRHSALAVTAYHSARTVTVKMISRIVLA